MAGLSFTTDRYIETRKRLGLVVLASDYTLEDELRFLYRDLDLAWFVSRIANSPNISTDSLRAMAPTITETAARLLPDDRIDVLAYACTSASAVMGSHYVETCLKAAKPMAATTDPARAAQAACAALGVSDIAVLTPYRDDVNAPLRRRLEDGGLTIRELRTFDEENDAVVGAMDGESISAAVGDLARVPGTEAVFVSCTSIRMVRQIEALENNVGIPVFSSNLALSWHCLQLAGLGAERSGFGRLWRTI